MTIASVLETLRKRFENAGLRRDADTVAITRREFAALHYLSQAAELGADPAAAELGEWRRLGASLTADAAETIDPETFSAPAVKAAAARAAGLPPPSRRGIERLSAVLRGDLRAVVRDLDDISEAEEARVSQALANGGSWAAYREAIAIAEERANLYLARAAASGELPEMIVVECVEVSGNGWSRVRRPISAVEDELRARCRAIGIEGPAVGAFGTEVSTPRGFQVTGLTPDRLAEKLVEFDRDQAETVLRHLIAALLGKRRDDSIGADDKMPTGLFCWSKDGETFRDEYPTAEAAAREGFDYYPEAASIMVGESVRLLASRFVRVDELLDQCRDAAEGEVGEACDDWLSFIDEKASALLETMIGVALQSIDPPSFYAVRGAVTYRMRDGVPSCDGEEIVGQTFSPD